MLMLLDSTRNNRCTCRNCPGSFESLVYPTSRIRETLFLAQERFFYTQNSCTGAVLFGNRPLTKKFLAIANIKQH